MKSIPHVILLFPLIGLIVITLSSCKDELPAPPVVGPEWVTFTHSTNRAIPNDGITTMVLDGENAVWIGTDSGAVSYKNGWTSYVDSLQYTLYGQLGPYTSAKVTSICESSDGSIWFGTWGDGIRRYNRFAGSGKTWIRYAPYTDTDNDGNPDLSNVSITSIVAIQSGTPRYVFVSSRTGVDRYEPSQVQSGIGTWSTIDAPPLPDQDIMAMSINPRTNLICFGTYSSGIAFLDEPINAWSYFRFPVNEDYPIQSIACDLWSNTFWFGKWEGVTSYDLNLSRDSSYTNTSTSGNLPSGKIYAVAVQSGTSRWFGTNRGLVNLSGSTWTVFTHDNTPELPSDIITALVFDSKGNLWIGTPAGIAVYNAKGTNL